MDSTRSSMTSQVSRWFCAHRQCAVFASAWGWLCLAGAAASSADLPTRQPPAPRPIQSKVEIPPYASRFQSRQKPVAPAKAMVAMLKDDGTGIKYEVYLDEDKRLLRLVRQDESPEVPGTIWWQAVLAVKDGVVLYEASDRVGFATVAGNKIGETYIDAELFYDGLAAVEKESKWGFIDVKGEEVIPPRFESVGSFREGFAPVEIDGHWGYIDRNGKIVIEPSFDGASGVENGVARVKLDDKVGSIDVSKLANGMPIDAGSSDIDWMEVEKTADDNDEDQSKDEDQNKSAGTSNVVYWTDTCRLRQGLAAKKNGAFSEHVYKKICAGLGHEYPVSGHIFPIKELDVFGNAFSIVAVVSSNCYAWALIDVEDVIWGRSEARCLDQSVGAGENTFQLENGPRTFHYMVCENSWRVVYSVSFKPSLWAASPTVCYRERGSTRCGTREPEDLLQQQCSSVKR